MTVIWTGMVVISILCGLATGRGPEVAAAAVEGTSAAVQLALSIAGMLCLWTGVMEVMRRSGLADKLSRLLGPILRRLFPQAARDAETMDSISANVSANLLGLGSAATPLGLEAARHGLRRALYAGGVQHRLHPAHPHHRGLRPGRSGLSDPLRHPPRRVAGLVSVGGGGDSGLYHLFENLEGLRWTCSSPCWFR